MSISKFAKNVATGYMLIAILFFGYNMLELPKMLYYAARLLIMAIVAFYAFNVIIHNVNRSSGIRLFLGYFLYACFTLVFLIGNKYASSLITEALMSGLFPMLFFFVGAVDSKEDLFNNKFYKYYFWGCIFMFVCSIYLFVTMPSWYIEWKRTMVIEEYEDNIKIIGSMSGFSGSGYLVGYTALFAFCYLLFKYKGKTAKTIDYLLMMIVVFCLVFSQARIAIFMAAVILLWYLATSLSLKTFVITIVVTIPFLIVLNHIISNSEIISGMFEILTEKVEAASDDKRYETGIALLSEQTNYLFGQGYGTGGHKARSLGLIGVTDFEYAKLFYETGIIGFLYFIIIAFKALSKKPRFTFEFFIIAFYLLAMLIANPLTAEATMSPVFWYALGRVICRQSSQRAVLSSKFKLVST